MILYLSILPSTVGALVWAAYHPASTLFGPIVRRAPSDRTIALTFDDGPNPTTTPRLLDLLDRHGARATFFVIGRWVRACPALAREIVQRGHALGNHTDTHRNLLLLPRRENAAELRRCQDAIEEAAGVSPVLMRPPWGARGPQLQFAVRGSGLQHVVLWTLMGRDWSARGKARLRARLAQVRGGDVVVLHDGYHAALGADREETLRALDHWLPRWRDRGLTCAAL